MSDIEKEMNEIEKDGKLLDDHSLPEQPEPEKNGYNFLDEQIINPFAEDFSPSKIEKSDKYDFALDLSSNSIQLRAILQTDITGYYLIKFDKNRSQILELYRRITHHDEYSSIKNELKPDNTEILNSIEDENLKLFINNNIVSVEQDSIPVEQRYYCLISCKRGSTFLNKPLNDSIYLGSLKNHITKELPEKFKESLFNEWFNFQTQIWYMTRVTSSFELKSHEYVFLCNKKELGNQLNALKNNYLDEGRINKIIDYVVAHEENFQLENIQVRLRYNAEKNSIDRIYLRASEDY